MGVSSVICGLRLGFRKFWALHIYSTPEFHIRVYGLGREIPTMKYQLEKRSWVYKGA